MKNLDYKQFNKNLTDKFSIPDEFTNEPFQLYLRLQDEIFIPITDKVSKITYLLIYYNDEALGLPYFERADEVAGEQITHGYVRLFDEEILVFDSLGQISYETVVNKIYNIMNSQPRVLFNELVASEISDEHYVHHVYANGELHEDKSQQVSHALQEHKIVTAYSMTQRKFVLLLQHASGVWEFPIDNSGNYDGIKIHIGFVDKQMVDFAVNFPVEDIESIVMQIQERIDFVNVKITEHNQLVVEENGVVVFENDDEATETYWKLIDENELTTQYQAVTQNDISENERNEIDKGDPMVLFNKETNRQELLIKVNDDIVAMPVVPLEVDEQGNIVELHVAIASNLTVRMAHDNALVDQKVFRNTLIERLQAVVNPAVAS